MLNVVGKDLVVEVPVNSLKAIGNFDNDTKHFQKQLRKVFEQSVDLLTEKHKKTFDESYLINVILAGIPISIMIEENITFESAIKAASQKMKDTCYQLDMQFAMFEFMPFADLMLDKIANELMAPAINISSNITMSEENAENICSVQIHDISENFSDVLENLGILSLAEKLSTVESLTDILQTSVFNPIVATITKCCNEKFEDFETDLSGRDEFNKIINEMLENLKNQYFIQTVLSIILTKAIGDNITLAEAISAYDEEILFNLAAKKVTEVKSLNNYATELEKMVDLLFELS